MAREGKRRARSRAAGRKSIRCIVFPRNPKTATKWRKRETVDDLKTKLRTQ